MPHRVTLALVRGLCPRLNQKAHEKQLGPKSSLQTRPVQSRGRDSSKDHSAHHLQADGARGQTKEATEEECDLKPPRERGRARSQGTVDLGRGPGACLLQTAETRRHTRTTAPR